MASVTSLDKDLRKLRLDKYTPAAAKEVSSWIESIIGERLSGGDLLESLKDGVALCKLINLAVPPPGVKFKKSAMPFVQMENISHFLRACKEPPLNLQEHDVFLTVDLYEQKDPAQVLQCLGAFSRAAHAANPAKFPTTIGGRSRGVMSPQGTGRGTPSPTRARGLSNASGFGSPRPNLASTKTGDSGSGRWSPTKPTSPTTSWSKKEHEGATSPAWNIAQYGYMGGASQGNLGISFGSRRQITSAGPHVPSLAEKEKKRREREAEEEKQRQQMEEEEIRRQKALEEEEARARQEEELAIEREVQLLREEKLRAAEQEKKQWEEQERQWRLNEEKRRKEEEEAEAQLAEERKRTRSRSDARLRGQFLSQYQAEEAVKPQKTGAERIAELEAELEKARERERQYERERQGRSGRPVAVSSDPKARLRSRSRPSDGTPSRQDSWSRNEREVLQTAWTDHQGAQQDDKPPAPPPRSPRPLPDPMAAAPPPQKVVAHTTGGRPLPDPATYKSSSQTTQNRTDRFLANNAAPVQPVAKQTYSRELGLTAEQDGEDRRRAESQNKTKAGGWASKSLLEREMEMERQRQREWEEAQEETAKAVPTGNGVDGIGGGIGGRWDVSQWAGYTGGDNQNRGSQGIGASRRQIVGPRPLPNTPR
ncbi:calponin [Colletotrichum truncatum]|uniref:Calponin n=1 Tax=Colletotrichum truncatum TaxID=5467 RepID=A0ACC3YGN1_COLTU|nr:calponin [Colletotrichum truncatum]KAF6781909.1 calponin [Colletotrichum truncatum]